MAPAHDSPTMVQTEQLIANARLAASVEAAAGGGGNQPADLILEAGGAADPGYVAATLILIAGGAS
jgi:hypothetical protein